MSNLNDALDKQTCMNVLITRRLAVALDTQARREGGCSRASLIRRACLAYLESHGVTDAQSQPQQREAA